MNIQVVRPFCRVDTGPRVLSKKHRELLAYNDRVQFLTVPLIQADPSRYVVYDISQLALLLYLIRDIVKCRIYAYRSVIMTDCIGFNTHRSDLSAVKYIPERAFCMLHALLDFIRHTFRVREIIRMHIAGIILFLPSAQIFFSDIEKFIESAAEILIQDIRFLWIVKSDYEPALDIFKYIRQIFFRLHTFCDI